MLHHSLHSCCAAVFVQVGSSVEFVESDGEVVEVTCIDGQPRNVFERWDNLQWRLQQAWSKLLGQQQQQEAEGQ
jgi:hypothetical protein